MNKKTGSSKYFRDEEFQKLLGEDDYEETSANDAESGKPHLDEKFTLIRLTFSESGFDLERGELEEGEFVYTPINSGRLPFRFHPALLKQERIVEKISALVREKAGDYLTPGGRLAVVFPGIWGHINRISYPGKMPPDELRRYAGWQLKITDGGDAEPQHFNFKVVNKDAVIIASVRKRVKIFAENIAAAIGCKLVRLSLAGDADIDLAEEEEDTTAKLPVKTFIPVPLILSILGIAVLITAGYLFKDRLASLLPERDKTPVVTAETTPDSTQTKPPVKPAATDTLTVKKPSKNAVETPAKQTTPPPAVPQEPKTRDVRQIDKPYSSLLKCLSSGEIRLSFLTVVDGSVRAEMSSPRREAFNTALDELKRMEFIVGAEITRIDKRGIGYDAFLDAKISDSILDEFRHPPYSVVQKSFIDTGIKIEEGIINGKLSQIIKVFELIDNNRFLFYKITLSESDYPEYYLWMDY
ncbi:MAG: hypothetical protein H8E87_07625 [FCB group bacterium]|nr:hypothetical protein [FCB group bacterium]